MAGDRNRPLLNAHLLPDSRCRRNDLAVREADSRITWKGSIARMVHEAKKDRPEHVAACLRHHRAVAKCRVIGAPETASSRPAGRSSYSGPGRRPGERADRARPGAARVRQETARARLRTAPTRLRRLRGEKRRRDRPRTG